MRLRSQDDDADHGKVFYADATAEAMLRPHARELCAPGEFGWERVKQNASRTVWRGRIDGQELYVKHFHGRALGHRVKRSVGAADAMVEMRFARYLAQYGVPTVSALAAMHADGLEWLATAAVPQAQSGDAWHAAQLAAGGAARRAAQAAIGQLATLVGRMHAAGVIHRDLHCGNVMVAPGPRGVELVLMDLDRMSRSRRTTRRARAKNLAQLFHDRMDFTTRTERLRFLKHYMAASGETASLRTWQLLVERFARPHTRRQYANRDRRILRNDRYFTRLDLGRGWRGHAVLASKVEPAGSRAAAIEFQTQWWREALADPASLLCGPEVRVIADTPSTLLVRRKLKVGPHEIDVYIHQSRRKRAWKILCDACRSSRAIGAFRMGHMLLARRIATALPLAAVERRRLGVLTDSLLITEAIDAPPLNVFLKTWLGRPGGGDARLMPAQQRALAQEMLWRLGRLLQQLHDNGFAHRDLKAQNILARWSPGQPAEVVLVNLQGLRRPWRLPTRRRFQGLMRLNVSLLECPAVNHAGRLRMLLGYLRRPGMGRIDFKPHWRALAQWSDRKLRQQIVWRQKRQRRQAARRPA